MDGLSAFWDFSQAEARGVGSVVAVTAPLTASDLLSGFVTIHFAKEPTEEEQAALVAMAAPAFEREEEGSGSSAAAAKAAAAAAVARSKRGAGTAAWGDWWLHGAGRASGKQSAAAVIPQQQRSSDQPFSRAVRRISASPAWTDVGPSGDAADRILAEKRSLLEDVCEAIGGALWVRRALTSFGACADRDLQRAAAVARSTHNGGNLILASSLPSAGSMQPPSSLLSASNQPLHHDSIHSSSAQQSSLVPGGGGSRGRGSGGGGGGGVHTATGVGAGGVEPQGACSPALSGTGAACTPPPCGHQTSMSDCPTVATSRVTATRCVSSVQLQMAPHHHVPSSPVSGLVGSGLHPTGGDFSRRLSTDLSSAGGFGAPPLPAVPSQRIPPTHDRAAGVLR